MAGAVATVPLYRHPKQGPSMPLRRLLVASALVLAALSASASAKEWKTVTIVLEGAYAPWNLTNPDGSLGGFEPELAKVLCAHAKIECKLVASDWDSAIPSLNAGKFDAIMDALSITDDRKKVIAFSIPYAATPASFATPKDSPYAKLPGLDTTIKLDGKPDDKPKVAALRDALKGTTIGIQTATVYAPFIYDNFKDIATVKEYKTSAERDLDLAAGRIDVGFDDSTYFLTAFQSPDNKNLALSGPSIAGPIWGEGEGVGLRKSDPELKVLFDDAIKAALADGTVKSLSEKWFKLNVAPE
jgi:octopine/nopaline transport system substrate-binding protein